MKTEDLNLQSLPLRPVIAVAGLNLLLLLVLLLIFCSSLSKPAGFEIRLPRAVVSEGLQGGLSIVITGENILYLNGKVVTLSELKKDLSKVDFKRQNIFIRVDRRASMSRVIDVWDLSRALGSNHVHIIESMENQ